MQRSARVDRSLRRGNETTEGDAAQWYTQYYGRRGEDRNDLLNNPEVLFQCLAYEVALTRAVRRSGVDPAATEVLDVGCGGGGNLLHLIRLGFPMRALHGVDIQASRVEGGRRQTPGLDLRCRDAAALDDPDGAFGLVIESTVFSTLPDDDVASPIASEMYRVTRPGGCLILVDWRLANPRDRNSSALNRRRLHSLFPAARLLHTERGALLPPVGRWLSAHVPATYFVVAASLPFLASQVAYVLEKPVDDRRSDQPG